MSATSPRIVRLLETALYVDDLSRSAAFYTKLFGLTPLRDSDRLVALEIPGHAVLLLFQSGTCQEPVPTSGGVIPGHDATGSCHLAFAIEPDELPDWETRLHTEGIPIESRVAWPSGAVSLYFRDPDQHLVELATPGLWEFTGTAE